jgi:hypothetical protein
LDNISANNTIHVVYDPCEHGDHNCELNTTSCETFGFGINLRFACRCLDGFFDDPNSSQRCLGSPLVASADSSTASLTDDLVPNNVNFDTNSVNLSFAVPTPYTSPSAAPTSIFGGEIFAVAADSFGFVYFTVTTVIRGVSSANFDEETQSVYLITLSDAIGGYDPRTSAIGLVIADTTVKVQHIDEATKRRLGVQDIESEALAAKKGAEKAETEWGVTPAAQVVATIGVPLESMAMVKASLSADNFPALLSWALAQSGLVDDAANVLSVVYTAPHPSTESVSTLISAPSLAPTDAAAAGWLAAPQADDDDALETPGIMDDGAIFAMAAAAAAGGEGAAGGDGAAGSTTVMPGTPAPNATTADIGQDVGQQQEGQKAGVEEANEAAIERGRPRGSAGYGYYYYDDIAPASVASASNSDAVSTSGRDDPGSETDEAGSVSDETDCPVGETHGCDVASTKCVLLTVGTETMAQCKCLDGLKEDPNLNPYEGLTSCIPKERRQRRLRGATTRGPGPAVG